MIVYDFESIWRIFEKELTAYVRSRLYDKSLTPDIMQEVAMKIFANQSTLESVEDIRSYLYSITRNQLIDFFRKHNKPLPDLTEITHNEPHIALECLPKTMQSLKPSDQKILQLHAIEGYKIAEIADTLKLSLEGTRSKLKRAKAKLSKELFSCCDFTRNSRGDIIDIKANKKCSC